MSDVNLKTVPIDELRLEIALRTGPRYQCQASDCRAFHDSPGKWDTCPSCGRKGYLCGSFAEDRESQQWQEWEDRTIERYRPNGTTAATAPSAPSTPLPPPIFSQEHSDAMYRAGMIQAGKMPQPSAPSVSADTKDNLITRVDDFGTEWKVTKEKAAEIDAAIAAQSKEGQQPAQADKDKP
jgi:hypothetical protein